MFLPPVIIQINGTDCRCSRGVATIIGVGQRSMLKRLRERGILNWKNLPVTNQMVYDGYFKIKRGQRWDQLTTYYTDQGIEFVKEICKDLPKKYEKPYKEKYDYILADLQDSI
jgi:hypothetical protein